MCQVVLTLTVQRFGSLLGAKPLLLYLLCRPVAISLFPRSVRYTLGPDAKYPQDGRVITTATGQLCPTASPARHAASRSNGKQYEHDGSRSFTTYLVEGSRREQRPYRLFSWGIQFQSAFSWRIRRSASSTSECDIHQYRPT